ncbi:multicopper oxidase domain-containing protein [Streptomyces sp. NBC_00386]|jgi:hypothetical protein|uniref:multicopper oxidase domain-containing protein n=1 Tax=Streptomyces sp. NBC_00386 TaxID=2975734 RepID=UPI002E21027F
MPAVTTDGLDLSADFSTGWQPRTADLAAAPGGTVHRAELHAAHTEIEVAPGVKQRMWTFGGTAPGPTLHGKVGDVFEVTLVNDDTGMGHGIDFHSGSLAPDTSMRTIQPGERLVYRFRAERAGAWLFHLAFGQGARSFRGGVNARSLGAGRGEAESPAGRFGVSGETAARRILSRCGNSESTVVA